MSTDEGRTRLGMPDRRRRRSATRAPSPWLSSSTKDAIAATLPPRNRDDKRPKVTLTAKAPLVATQGRPWHLVPTQPPGPPGPLPPPPPPLQERAIPRWGGTESKTSGAGPSPRGGGKGKGTRGGGEAPEHDYGNLNIVYMKVDATAVLSEVAKDLRKLGAQVMMVSCSDTELADLLQKKNPGSTQYTPW